jgi:hypothetical protein
MLTALGVKGSPVHRHEYPSVPMNAELARQRGSQVGHSLNVIAELPRYVDDNSIPVALRVAAIDAFVIHTRLLTEFLIKPADKRDIRRHDYAPGFQLPAPLRTRLNKTFQFASRHVAHLSKERVPAKGAAIFEPVGAARLRRLAADVFAGMDAFVQYLIVTSNPYATDFQQWVSEANGRRTN